MGHDACAAKKNGNQKCQDMPTLSVGVSAARLHFSPRRFSARRVVKARQLSPGYGSNVLALSEACLRLPIVLVVTRERAGKAIWPTRRSADAGGRVGDEGVPVTHWSFADQLHIANRKGASSLFGATNLDMQ